MAKFKCNTCSQVYEDYYPVDDCCIKCKKGRIRIVNDVRQEEPRQRINKKPSTAQKGQAIKVCPFCHFKEEIP